MEKGPSLTYYGPALDLPLGGFGPKVNTNERGLEYFIPTKFGEYPPSDSVVKSDYVFQYIYICHNLCALYLLIKHKLSITHKITITHKMWISAYV